MKIERSGRTLDLDDYLDNDKEINLHLSDGWDAAQSIFINKMAAKQIVDHLTQVFELKQNENS